MKIGREFQQLLALQPLLIQPVDVCLCGVGEWECVCGLGSVGWVSGSVCGWVSVWVGKWECVWVGECVGW